MTRGGTRPAAPEAGRRRAHRAPRRTPAHVAPRRTPPGGAARDVALAVVGVPGLLVVAWLVVSTTLSLSLVVLATGSMSPTMPAGTAAVVRTTPATELRVGDVVTVPRPDGSALVTHRVVAVDDIAGEPATRSLTLRGDANSAVDRDPYVVTEAGRVLASLPGAGRVVDVARRPAVALGGVLLVAALVCWGLWPTAARPDDADDADDVERDGPDDDAHGADVDPTGAARDAVDAAPART